MDGDPERGRGKLDSRLHHSLGQLERVRDERGDDHDEALDAQRVGVWVRFSDDLEAAQRAGLHVEVVSGDLASGSIALRDLDRVAACEGVLSISAVERYRPALNSSLPAIHADHGSVVTSGGGSGTGVIVGVVDSGIDVFHQNFRKGNSTRILALLDLTLRQTISLNGTVPGGTFTLTWAGRAGAEFPSPLPVTPALP